MRDALTEKDHGVRAILSAGFESIGPELLKDLPELKLILGMAALDVFEQEPPINDVWKTVPNTVLSPHVGGATSEFFAKSVEQALENVRQAYGEEAYVNRVI